MSPATVISLCTLRLQCSEGNRSSVGTGFLYQYNISLLNNGAVEKYAVPLIITNKHVVAGFSKLTTTLTLVPEDAVLTDHIEHVNETHQSFSVDDLQTQLINHPDPNVDIAAFPLTALGNMPAGTKARIFAIDEGFSLSDEERSITRAIEPVVMVGYPDGLWDSTNNRPVSRRGITASHPLHHWNGEKKFLIDAACFPGSSGSPVFQFEDGVFRGPGDILSIGSRAKLLGVLFAGPLITQEGQIEQRTIPTSTTYVAVTKSMMNLGFVVPADALKDFEPILKYIVCHQLGLANPIQDPTHSDHQV